jgi:subtilisin family serine protease
MDPNLDPNAGPAGPEPASSVNDAAVEALLRAAAVPLRVMPASDVRHAHIAAAASRVAGGAPVGRHAARTRRSWVQLPAFRPALAAGLAVSLVVGLVAVLPTSLSLDGLLQRGTRVEIAMAAGFTPSSVPVERTEDHVILTVDAAGAEALSAELSALLGGELTVLSVRSDRSTFTVPASVVARLSAPEAIEIVADTPVSSLTTATVQSPTPSWGLDRIDALDDRLDDSYAYVSTGRGVRVYVIDTGVLAEHPDFGGRVIPGWSAIDDGRGTSDCNGHGTHVAGTVAGRSFGVAKDALIVAVRALDCSGAGFASSLVAGINWVVANHPGGPGVINLSVGGPANSAVDRAVADATARGLTVVAAAGNDGGDACAVSPARAVSAVTIGATTSRDERASYSNTGACVDVFAPGSGITSTYIGPTGAVATMSGTSMAAPHVAGLAARILQDRPGASPADVAGFLTGSASSGVISGADGAPNLLVNYLDGDLPEEVDCDALSDALELGEGSEDEELPEECLEDDERERDTGGRFGPRDPGDLPPGINLAPGLAGRLPPGFGGTPPGLSRRDDERRTPPGLGGLPPGRPDARTPEQEEEDGSEDADGSDEAARTDRTPGPPSPGESQRPEQPGPQAPPANAGGGNANAGGGNANAGGGNANAGGGNANAGGGNANAGGATGGGSSGSSGADGSQRPSAGGGRGNTR